mgnify:CR=1 FL=1
MFFVRDARMKVKTTMLHVPKKDIMLEVGKLWRQISSIDLQYYQTMAKEYLLRFKREHGEFVSRINQMRHMNIPLEESASKK